MLYVEICQSDNLRLCYYHVTYEFQCESTLYSLPECQGTPCSKQAPYLSLSDSNEIRTHNHLAKLVEWLSVRLRTKWLWVRISLQSPSFNGFYEI